MRRIISIIIMTALFAAGQVAHADILIATNPDVVVELQPNAAWGSPMPAECRITYNYTTGKVVVEPRPEPSVSNQMRAPCTTGWLVNFATFWHWFKSEPKYPLTKSAALK